MKKTLYILGGIIMSTASIFFLALYLKSSDTQLAGQTTIQTTLPATTETQKPVSSTITKGPSPSTTGTATTQKPVNPTVTKKPSSSTATRTS